MHGEYFSHVLFPGLNGELIDADVEELNGAIAGSYQDLVLVRLGPGEVEEGVLRVEPLALCKLRDRRRRVIRFWRTRGRTVDTISRQRYP